MILVTGASGFLGRCLVKRLTDLGKQVRAVYMHHLPTPDLELLPGIHWVKCDLLDVCALEEIMPGITEIYHCAAIVSFDPLKHRDLLLFNPESTANVVNLALEYKIRKLVYVSSVAALGKNDAGKIINEEQEWQESRFNSAYGVSKYLAEMEVWRGIGEGLNAVIVNPGIIIGPGRPGDPTWPMLETVWSEFPFYPVGTTAWVDARDVSEILVRLMGGDISGQRFILSAGIFSFREVLGKLAVSLSKRPPFRRAGPLLASMAWRWAALRAQITRERPFLTKESAQSATLVQNYDNVKLLRVLEGFSYTPLSDSLNAMAQNFMEFHKN